MEKSEQLEFTGTWRELSQNVRIMFWLTGEAFLDVFRSSEDTLT